MYGNGRPGPTASGVNAGKICSWKCLASSSRVAPESSQRDDPDPVLSERGLDHVGELMRVATVLLADLLGEPLEHLSWTEPVWAPRVDPSLELVVHAGDTDHEELVQVGDVDR